MLIPLPEHLQEAAKMNDKNNFLKKSATKFDLLLILLLLAAGGGFFLWQRERSAGDKVLIWSENELVTSFSLKKDTIYTVTTDLGTNTIVIENGQVRVTDADCPDKICEQMGLISKPGETIVCLPHKLVVEVSDEH